MNAILGQVVQHGGGGVEWTTGDIAVRVIIAVAIIAIVVVFLRYALKFEIPQWFWYIIGIVVCAVVCILAIRFLLTL